MDSAYYTIVVYDTSLLRSSDTICSLGNVKIAAFQKREMVCMYVQIDWHYRNLTNTKIKTVYILQQNVKI